MIERLRPSTVCFNYSPDGERCRASCLEPVFFCCATHLHQYQHTPTAQLLGDAAEAILASTKFTKQGLPMLACLSLSTWKRLCNALNALSFHGYHDDAELLTLLVSSIESIRGPWQGQSKDTRKGKSFERLVTRLYLEELGPFVRAAPMPPEESVRVLWDEKLPSLPGGKRQIDVLLRRDSAQGESLTIVECRDHEVEVGEMDGFVTLVRHVGASQGVMVSSEGFQSGARDCARLEGIETRVVTEEDFSEESIQRVVNPMYAFEPLLVKADARNGGLPVSFGIPPYGVEVMRNGIITGTLANLVNQLVESGTPVPGSMPPQIAAPMPGDRLLLPNGTSIDPAAIHIMLKVVEREKTCTLVTPRRPLSFRVAQPLQGTSRRVEAWEVPLFPSPGFEAGQFYVNLMGQRYHCNGVTPSSATASIQLLDDRQQEGGPTEADLVVPFDQAGHYHPLDDRKAIKALRVVLKRLGRRRKGAGPPRRGWGSRSSGQRWR